MSQKLKTKTKLTPEQVFPRWTRLLDKTKDLVDTCLPLNITNMHEHDMVYFAAYQYEKKAGLGIASAKYCVVGEARGFSAGYLEDCEECRHFSSGGFYDKENERVTPSFVLVYSNLKYGTIKDWRNTDTVQKFLNHMEEKHSLINK